MAIVKGALRSVNGEEKVSNDVSGYYIAGEIGRTHEGMAVAIPSEEWEGFQTMADTAFIALLLTLAGNIQLDKYKKHRRGPQKNPPRKSVHRVRHMFLQRSF